MSKLLLPKFFTACTSDQAFIPIPTAPSLPPNGTTDSVDTGASTIPITSAANYPLGQMVSACLFDSTICPPGHADCTIGVDATNAKIAKRLTADAQQFVTGGELTLNDIIGNRVPMTVLDSVKHKLPILDSDWDGSAWTNDAWIQRQYTLWIALGDHTEELAEAAPLLLANQYWEGFDSPVALSFDAIQCSAIFYSGTSNDENHVVLYPWQTATIKSSLFPKNDTHPFPTTLSNLYDVLDGYDDASDTGVDHGNDNQYITWIDAIGTSDHPLSGQGFYSTDDGEDLSASGEITNSYADGIRDSALNALGLTAYSDPTEQTQVLLQDVPTN
jgi:hypothetical protein